MGYSLERMHRALPLIIIKKLSLIGYLTKFRYIQFYTTALLISYLHCVYVLFVLMRGFVNMHNSETLNETLAIVLKSTDMSVLGFKTQHCRKVFFFFLKRCAPDYALQHIGIDINFLKYKLDKLCTEGRPAIYFCMMRKHLFLKSA